MTVEIRKDSVGQYVQLGGGFAVPSIDTKNVTTQIAVNNGDTAVIGGIYEETISNDVDQGAVPRRPADRSATCSSSTGRTSEKTELLIFLTPRIVKDTVDVGAVGRAARAPPRASAAVDLDYNAPVQLHRGNLFLVGPARARASRRSGAQLARRLGKRFVDADTELEQRLGVSIPTIFEIEGEAGFRDREEAMLADLARRPDIVLATGGGVVLRPANRERLKANGTVVYLHAEPAIALGAHRAAAATGRCCNDAPTRSARLAELYAHPRRAVPRGRRHRRRVRARRDAGALRARRSTPPARARGWHRVMITRRRRARRAQLPDPHRRGPPRARRRAARGAAAVAPRGHRHQPGRWPRTGSRRCARASAAPASRAQVAADSRRRDPQELGRRCTTSLTRLLEMRAERSTTLVALGGGVVGDLAGLRRGDLPARHAASCRCRRRCSRRSTRRSAARPASTIRWART